MLRIRRKRLSCSFCGRSDAEVEKLVAGARPCDRCVATASKIIANSNSGGVRERQSGFCRRTIGRLTGWFGLTRRTVEARAFHRR